MEEFPVPSKREKKILKNTLYGAKSIHHNFTIQLLNAVYLQLFKE